MAGTKEDHLNYQKYLAKKGWSNAVEHQVGTLAEHNQARLALLAEEKALQKKRDELARQRQAIPWVLIEFPKKYKFTKVTASGPEKETNLLELFRPGVTDLVVYHMMLGDNYEKPCISCSLWVDNLNGVFPHLNSKCNVAVIAKAGPAKIVEAAKTKGWTLPLYSAAESTFVRDFDAEHSASDVGKKIRNYGTAAVRVAGLDAVISVFTYRDGKVYLTYQTFQRGLEYVNAVSAYMDLLPDGRGNWQPDHKEDYGK